MIYNRQFGGRLAEKDVEKDAKKDTGERSGKTSEEAQGKQGGIVLRKLTQIRVERGKVKAG